jgi:hypothetical protein
LVVLDFPLHFPRFLALFGHRKWTFDIIVKEPLHCINNYKYVTKMIRQVIATVRAGCTNNKNLTQEGNFTVVHPSREQKSTMTMTVTVTTLVPAVRHAAGSSTPVKDPPHWAEVAHS